MTKDDPGQDSASGGDDRLASLDERLQAARDAETVRTAPQHGKPEKGYSQGNRVLSELIAGPAGGALLGWLFDRWLGTSPGLLLVMMTLGIVIAFRNIIRISNERPE
ncbi:AtpZ/AtpI family protein [Sphingomonas montanisoli]|uniref:ATP synthase protein I n=1 Tax=Sphingomonas montanisoli TaxID=2606412 RepID=A0A5D9BZV0_9SPHN|nr:AtpZ/AtpI family protein [Sphingomonas montanisoli]TZG25148.1 F0F1 ATP synthase assembly protein I [Sphingomonas montanisoli]